MLTTRQLVSSLLITFTLGVTACADDVPTGQTNSQPHANNTATGNSATGEGNSSSPDMPGSQNSAMASDMGGESGNANTNATQNSTTNNSTNDANADMGATAVDMNTPFPINEEGQVLCGDVACVCSDGMDNDGDGLIDGFDPECTGPFDNDEASFATGIPGDNKDPVWQDCFFDGNSGSGDDKCRYKTGCLDGSLSPDDPDCQLSAACLEFCAPRTPNGCDCFGCCEVYKDDGSTVNVVIGTECSLDKIDDESACPRCVQSTQCNNTCGTCELCLGKSIENLPEECYDPSTPTNSMTGQNNDPANNQPINNQPTNNDPANNTPGNNQPTNSTPGNNTSTNNDPTNNTPLPYQCDGGLQACSPDVACDNPNTHYCYLGCCYEFAG